MDPFFQDENTDAPTGGKRYLGRYFGYVRDNKDPESRGRVKVYCPEVMGELDSEDTWLDWAEASAALSGYDQGLFMVPPVPANRARDSDGDDSPYNQTRVWVTFRNGDPSRPIYETGATWLGTSDLPNHTPTLSEAVRGGDESVDQPNYTSSTVRITTEVDGTVTVEEPVPEPGPSSQAVYPDNIVFKAPGGVSIEIDSTAGQARIRIYHPSGSCIEINNAGTMVTSVKGRKSEIVSGDTVEVSRGAKTVIVEQASHEQYNSSSTVIRKGTTSAVYGGNNDEFCKSGKNIVVAGQMATVAAGISIESNSALQVVATDEVALGTNSFSCVSIDTEITAAKSLVLQGGTSTKVVCKTPGVGVVLEGSASIPVHYIYASSDIDVALTAMQTAMTAVLNPATLGAALIAPTAVPVNVAGIVAGFGAVLAALNALTTAFSVNKTVHRATKL